MKSIDKLRDSLKDCTTEAGIEPNRFDTYWITSKACDMLIDEIEAEIAANYLELPKDADGVPIRVGDKVEWLEGNGTYKVCGVGKLVVLRTHESYCFTIDPGCLRIVKPRTLEDVLRDVWKEALDYAKSDIWRNPDEVFAERADEIRDLLGGDAE